MTSHTSPTCQERRGQFVGVDHLPGGGRACVRYAAPLAEVVTDFFDELKSVTRGYATMSYAPAGHRRADLVLLELRLNGEPCDALAVIVHRDAACVRAWPGATAPRRRATARRRLGDGERGAAGAKGRKDLSCAGQG